MKPSLQCEKAANSANATLGMIARSFHYRTRKVLIPLYKTFVRPKLEYAATVWNPWLQKDIDTLERVQKRLIRMLSDAPGSTYEERMNAAGLVSLSERRLRGDMIETFKTYIYNQVIKEDWFKLQEETSRPTRSNSVMGEGGEVRRKEVLAMERTNLEVRRHFFTVRVEKVWNVIPEEVKEQKSINAFKNRYDMWRRKYILRQEIEEAGPQPSE